MNRTIGAGPVRPQARRTVMGETSSPDNRLDALAEEFLCRRRGGERPSVEEYAAAHPDLADAIHRLFPALLAMEDLRPDSAGVTGSHGGAARPGSIPLPDRVGDFR